MAHTVNISTATASSLLGRTLRHPNNSPADYAAALEDQAMVARAKRTGFGELMASHVVMGCEGKRIVVSITSSLDEGPQVVRIEHEHAGDEFPDFNTVYAPRVDRQQAELLLTLLDGAPEDANDTYWLNDLRESLLIIANN